MNNFTFREELRVKIALIYNRESQNVINLFGLPNREKIGKKTIKRITDALKKGGHQVIALEGDKDLVDRLEEFMPRVLKGERPGMAFNVSYGIQGQARYTHVPSILGDDRHPLCGLRPPGALTGVGQGRHQDDPPPTQHTYAGFCRSQRPQ